MASTVVALATFLTVCAAMSVLAHSPSPPHGHSKAIPMVYVDLDRPPQERWAAVVTPYTKSIAALIDFVLAEIPKELVPTVQAIAGDIDRFVPAPYADEIRGIANATGLPIGDITIMNMFYELTCFCTSIVAQNANGTMMHARNLDYSMPGMQTIAVTVDFQRGGQSAYKAVTFAGYIGVMTGVRPGGFAVTVDERDQKNATIWTNAIEAIFKGGRSLGLMLRDALEHTDDYASALQTLATQHLITTSYIILSGAQRNEGAVITRDRQGPANVWLLDYPSTWFLVETNYDHWNPAPAHDDRRSPANARMRASSPETISSSYLVNTVLGQFPVLNSMTIYSAYVCAQTGDLVAITQNND